MADPTPHKPLVSGSNPVAATLGILKLKKKKKPTKAPKKLPDFSLEDILNAPKPKVINKRIDGLGCPQCGSLRYISKDEVKVFRGQRMKVFHCHGCKQDFYKSE